MDDIDSASSSLCIVCGLSGGASRLGGGSGSGGHGVGTATVLVVVQAPSEFAASAISVSQAGL